MVYYTIYVDVPCMTTHTRLSNLKYSRPVARLFKRGMYISGGGGVEIVCTCMCVLKNSSRARK